jgi:hypothetical protein
MAGEVRVENLFHRVAAPSGSRSRLMAIPLGALKETSVEQAVD